MSVTATPIHIDLELDACAREVVRATWGERLSDRLAALDMGKEFAAAGHRYAELDEIGEIRVVTPTPKR